MLPEPFLFQPYTTLSIAQLLVPREGETKLGETVHYGSVTSKTKFLVLGIEENIGPQSNLGLSGSEKAFKTFLKRFLNMQANRHIDGSQICILGSIQQITPFSSLDEGRKHIEMLDNLVHEVLLTYGNKNMLPIVIGGGHNNAFPLIKFAHSAHRIGIQVINMDPHADCRPMEGRHSGNPFSYAFDAGLLEAYHVIGLHKAYNSEYILRYLDDKNCLYRFFEDYIDHPEHYDTDLTVLFESLSNKLPLGIELDMDAIQHMPSSAFTPSGITLEQARKYLRLFAQHTSAAYLHLPEAAPQTADDEKIVGKALAYLVWDFIQVRQHLSITT